MPKQKKKSPGRPKKEFISRKPKTKIKSGPGRPRKDKKDRIKPAETHITPEVASFVAKSVDESKRKDLIILLLFLLSFILFVVSLYFTFMRNKKADQLSQEDMAQITNIETGNINYTTENAEVPVTVTSPAQETQPIVQAISKEQQIILDFYQAVNTVDMDAIYHLTDSHLETSNVFKTYYSRRWLSSFSESILAPKIVVSNIQEESTTENPNIKKFTFTLEYTLASNQQKFTEERSTVLIKKGDDRKIGKLMCETKGCSTMPFFNPEKYK